jgi:hypothetical protein
MLILKAILLHDYGVALSYLLPVSFCLCRVSKVVTSRHLQLNDLDVRYSRFLDTRSMQVFTAIVGQLKDNKVDFSHILIRLNNPINNFYLIKIVGMFI